MNDLRPRSTDFDDAPLHVQFYDAAAQQQCLLMEETHDNEAGDPAIYIQRGKAWKFWRSATPDEVKDILAATGND